MRLVYSQKVQPLAPYQRGYCIKFFFCIRNVYYNRIKVTTPANISPTADAKVGETQNV